MHKQQRFYGLLALCMTVWFAAQFAYQWWIYAPDPTAHTVLTIANIAQQIVVMLLLCFTLVTNTNRASVVHPDDITPRQNIASARIYALWLRNQFGNHVQVVEPCFCGYYGDVYHACSCSVKAIERYQRRLRRITSDAGLYIELADVSAEKMLSTRKPEADETIIARVQAAQQRQKLLFTYVDMACTRLLQAAIRQLALNEQQVAQMQDIAASISALDMATEIRPAHLAEALQYRVR